MLRRSGLSCIDGCDTVIAVSQDPNGELGDIVLVLGHSDARIEGHGRREHRVRVTQGNALLTVLNKDVQDVFRTLGDTHWGDVTGAVNTYAR